MPKKLPFLSLLLVTALILTACVVAPPAAEAPTVWMREYWNDFIQDIGIKNTDWKYEKECRLILHGGLQEELSGSERLWNYEFESLKGIIFGIRTSDADKLKAIETIQRKCLESNRTDFKFYQACYRPHDGMIQKRELRIF